MWLVTNFGFFRIVQKKGDDILKVNARARIYGEVWSALMSLQK